MIEFVHNFLIVDWKVSISSRSKDLDVTLISESVSPVMISFEINISKPRKTNHRKVTLILQELWVSPRESGLLGDASRSEIGWEIVSGNSSLRLPIRDLIVSGNSSLRLPMPSSLTLHGFLKFSIYKVMLLKFK